MFYEIHCWYRSPGGAWQHDYQSAGTCPPASGNDATQTVANVERMGFWSKTAELAKRFFSGSIGAAVPLACSAVYRYAGNPVVPDNSQLYELGLYTAGLGLASAIVTSTSKSAFNRGAMFSSVAEITSLLGGIGKGESWKSASTAINSLIVGASGFIATCSDRCSETFTGLSQKLSNMQLPSRGASKPT